MTGKRLREMERVRLMFKRIEQGACKYRVAHEFGIDVKGVFFAAKRRGIKVCSHRGKGTEYCSEF